MELRHTVFYGDLYDDNERWLLSAYPFTDTYHLVDLRGRPIFPKKQRGMLPAGTQVQIRTVEFPTAWQMTKRMVTTPRYNPWLICKVAQKVANFPENTPPLVLILPDELPNEQDVELAIGNVLAPVGEVSQWLTTLRPTVQVAIAHKTVLPGMTRHELVASQGEPIHWFVDHTDDGRAARVAWYPHQEIWMIENSVLEIRASRTLHMEPTPES